MRPRYLQGPLANHLKNHRQMIFLTGPRQVGKTTLAKGFLGQTLPGVNYFNWDIADHRRRLTTQIFSGKTRLDQPSQGIVVFDEIHKYSRWKNALKGLFDLHEPDARWIITGSAALDVRKKGQDSLMGRYFTYHLAPFSLAELQDECLFPPLPSKLALQKFQRPDPKDQNFLEKLLQFGGFPEPYEKGDSAFLLQWRQARLDRLINQDLAAMENLRHIDLVENLMFLLPERVGSPLSINSLREDLEVHFSTVKHWLQLLERVFYGFPLPPYHVKATRTLKKETKWYLWDWTEIEEAGSRFENLVAVHLLKYILYLNDLGKGAFSLHYIRDKEKREVDFLICERRKPLLAIECKLKPQPTPGALAYYAKRFDLQRTILLTLETVEPQTFVKDRKKIVLVPAASFLKMLV